MAMCMYVERPQYTSNVTAVLLAVIFVLKLGNYEPSTKSTSFVECSSKLS